MSLDVYLEGETQEGGPCEHCSGTGRERPYRDTLFSRNITHNLGEMADKAGLYKAMWRPEEVGITTAAQLLGPLRAGLEALRSRPDFFKGFNPENGWGDYDGLVQFVEAYLSACEENPGAKVSANR